MFYVTQNKSTTEIEGKILSESFKTGDFVEDKMLRGKEPTPK